jgi:hypothetical protein
MKPGLADGSVAKAGTWGDEPIKIHSRANFRDFDGSQGWCEGGGTGAAAPKASHCPIVAVLCSPNTNGKITTLTYTCHRRT